MRLSGITICLIYLIVALPSCSRDEPTATSSAAGPVYTIRNNNFQSHNDASNYLEVKIIPISAAVADSIGGADQKSELFFADSIIFFVKRFQGLIGALSLQGELLWLRESHPDDIESYASINYIDLNPQARHLVVADNKRQSFVYYDYSGRFLNREKMKLFFTDRMKLDDRNWLYDLTGFINPEVLPVGTRTPRLTQWDGTSATVWNTLPSQKPDEMTYNDMESFFQIDHTFFYQYSFSDSVFRVSNPGTTLAYLLKFREKNEAQAIIDDPATRNYYLTIYERGVPHVHRSILYQNKVYAIYEYGPVRRFAIVDETGRNLVNSDRIIIDGTVLNTPWNYWNGHFFTSIPDYTFDYLQKLPEYDFNPPAEVVEAQRKIEQQRGDRSGGVIAILSVK